MLAAIACVAMSDARVPRQQGSLISRVETQQKVVALTFDGAPSDRISGLLRILRQFDVKATFYCLGSRLAAHPEFGRQLVSAGHELGNNSYTRRPSTFAAPSKITSDIERTDEQIRLAGYTGEITFRPPGEERPATLPRYLLQTKRTTVTWDVAVTHSRSLTPDQIARDIAEDVRPGSIVAMRPWRQSASAALDQVAHVVRHLKDQGYRFLTVSALLATAGHESGRPSS